MLSYQHGFHAGNLADVHKHAMLAWMLDYLTRKDKPLSYIETHAGRGLYDLGGAQAEKTGEAAKGIEKVEGWFSADDPYTRVLNQIRQQHGKQAYPGSPMIAASLLRADDKISLAELHPTEHRELCKSMLGSGATIHKKDGFEAAYALCPPSPRRGLMLIDPSYEVKADWQAMPRHLVKLAKAWNVGVIALWYPILTNGAHQGLLKSLKSAHKDALASEVRFPPARPGHGMVGSGMFVVNPPYGLEDYTKKLAQKFAALMKGRG